MNKALYGKTLGHYTAAEIYSAFPRLFEKAFTFSLVRNPWDRVLSAYRFARAGRTESMGVYNSHQYQIPEFERFELFVCEWLPRQKVETLDFIFKPQWSFVCDSSGAIMVDHLGFVEDIDNTIKLLSARLCKPLVVSNANSTKKSDSDFRKSYLNSEMIEVVGEIYRKDVEVFGYKFG